MVPLDERAARRCEPRLRCELREDGCFGYRIFVSLFIKDTTGAAARQGVGYQRAATENAMNTATSLQAKRSVVEGIIDAWKRKDIDGVLAQLCDDVEYHYLVGERPLLGKEWVRRFLERFGDHIGEPNHWRILRCAESGDALLVEGVDDYRSTDGTHVRYPYMGVFEFRDGRVARWRDYADGALIARVRRGEELPDWLEALVA